MLERAPAGQRDAAELSQPSPQTTECTAPARFDCEVFQELKSQQKALLCPADLFQLVGLGVGLSPPQVRDDWKVGEQGYHRPFHIDMMMYRFPESFSDIEHSPELYAASKGEAQLFTC
jgi:hypothetical protein